MPSRCKLEFDEDIGKQESVECHVRFGLSNMALGHYDASPIELEADEDIDKW